MDSLALWSSSGCADCGAGFAPVRRIGGYNASRREAKVGHGARHRSDVEWIARGDEDDADAVALSFEQQRINCRAGSARKARRSASCDILHSIVWSPSLRLKAGDEAALRDGTLVLRARMGSGDERQLQRAVGQSDSDYANGLDKGAAHAGRSAGNRHGRRVLWQDEGSPRRRRACTSVIYRERRACTGDSACAFDLEHAVCRVGSARLGHVPLEGYELLKGLTGLLTHAHTERVPILENSQDYEALAGGRW